MKTQKPRKYKPYILTGTRSDPGHKHTALRSPNPFVQTPKHRSRATRTTRPRETGTLTIPKKDTHRQANPTRAQRYKSSHKPSAAGTPAPRLAGPARATAQAGTPDLPRRRPALRPSLTSARLYRASRGHDGQPPAPARPRCRGARAELREAEVRTCARTDARRAAQRRPRRPGAREGRGEPGGGGEPPSGREATEGGSGPEAEVTPRAPPSALRPAASTSATKPAPAPLPAHGTASLCPCVTSASSQQWRRGKVQALRPPPWIPSRDPQACLLPWVPPSTPSAKRDGRTRWTQMGIHKVKYNKMFNEQIRISKYETATERGSGTETTGCVRKTKENQLLKPGWRAGRTRSQRTGAVVLQRERAGH